MNELLMEENDRPQKQVSNLVYENGYFRQHTHNVTRVSKDTSSDSVVTSGQHQLTLQPPPRDVSPARLSSIAEETLTEFLSKATGTTVEWAMKVVVVYRPSVLCDNSENVYSLLARVNLLEQDLAIACSCIVALQGEVADVSGQLASQIEKYKRRKAEVFGRGKAPVERLRTENPTLQARASFLSARDERMGFSLRAVVEHVKAPRVFFLAVEAEAVMRDAYWVSRDRPGPSDAIHLAGSALTMDSLHVCEARDHALAQYGDMLVPVDVKHCLRRWAL